MATMIATLLSYPSVCTYVFPSHVDIESNLMPAANR